MSRSRSSPLRPFHYRQYAVWWSGAFVSNVGSWMETIAVGVYVTETTHKAAWTGAVAALAYLPTVVVGPFGGALADRFDRRRYVAVLTLIETVLAGALAVLAATNSLSLPLVSVIVLLEGCAIAFVMPAFTAILPELVEQDDLLAAMSLSSAQYNLGRVIGPALAGIAIATGGYAWAFAINTVSFGAVLIAVALVHLSPVDRRTRAEPLLGNIRVGFDMAWRDRGIRTALLLMLATAVLVSPFIGLIPAVAIKVFHRGAAATSLLVTAQGIGAVASAVAAGPVAARIGRGRLLVCALLLVGPAAVVYGLAPVFVVALPALVVLGGVYLAVLSGVSTTCQLRAPPVMRARVASLFMMVLGFGYPLGLVLQGLLGDRIGLRVVTVAGGVLLLLIVGSTRLLNPGAMRLLGTARSPAPAAPLEGALAPTPAVASAPSPGAGPPV